MECGIIYIKIVTEDENLSWLKYCNIFGAISGELQRDIRKTIDYINLNYSTGIIVPLSYTVQNGCVVKTRYVEIIANEIYNSYIKLLSKYTDKPYVRLVYSIGEVDDVSVGTIHELRSYPVVVNVGRFLDLSNEMGIYKI
jgi:hypothetical protein